MKYLFMRIPDLRLGILVHGDYSRTDGTNPVKIHDFSTDPVKLVNFIEGVSCEGKLTK